MTFAVMDRAIGPWFCLGHVSWGVAPGWDKGAVGPKIACDNGKIGTYAKLVDDRNESAHPNGNIFYSTDTALDVKITEILRRH